MIRTLFVLDFDGTYSFKEPGILPMVFMVPADRIEDVEKCALNASDVFSTCMEFWFADLKEKVETGSWERAIDFINRPEELPETIKETFVKLLWENGIEFQYVGNLNIPFKERQNDYLADYIPREIV